MARRGGKRVARLYSTQAEALAVIERATEALGLEPGLTVSKAINRYETHRREQGIKPGSAAATTHRLHALFVGELETVLARLTPEKCASLYSDLAKRPSKTGRPYAADTHRNTLSEAKTFAVWCVEQGFMRRNPFAGVTGTGRRRKGKAQLRIDEARKWVACAVEYATAGETGAIAALMTMVMGMRCSEIVSRQVRDLDDAGRVLWIPEAKTDAGRRTLHVPETTDCPLRTLLLEQAEGKGALDLLLGYHDRAWPRLWVQRICTEAKVPQVTAHGMRGLNATLGLEAGLAPLAVAASLGHESPAITIGTYAQPGAGGEARQERALRVLAGGRRG